MRYLLLLICFPLLAMDIVELPLAKSNQVTFKWMFSVGSIDDPATQWGIANLTAELLLQGGSKEYSKQQIDELFYPMAPQINASVDKEVIAIEATIHKDHAKKFLAILNGMLLEPRFDPADFDRMVKSTLKSLEQDLPNNNDEELGKTVLQEMIFANHPYGHLSEGSIAAIKALKLDDLKAFYKKNFTKGSLLLGIAGGFDAALKKELLDAMGKLPDGALRKANLPPTPAIEGVHVRIISKPGTFGSAISMGYPLAIDRGSKEFAALMVANSYLGEHRKSYGKLYNNMREARSMNYGDYSYIEWYPRGGNIQLPDSGFPRSANFFSIWIRPVQIGKEFQSIPELKDTKLGNAHYAIRMALHQMDLLAKNGMSEEDFQRTRQFLMGYVKLYVQSQSSRLGFLMDSRYYGRKDYISEILAELAKLKREDVNAAAAKYFQYQNLNIAVITDPEEAVALAASLKANASAPIVYKPVVRAGLSEKMIQEDAEVDALKLNIKSVEVVPSSSLFQ